ncbi:MAG: AAA family ATPase [Chlamydiales bacterium]
MIISVGLIVTAVAFAIIQGVSSSYQFKLAAVISGSMGASLFFSTTILACVAAIKEGMAQEAKAKAKAKVTATAVRVPVAMTIGTRAFFESQGIFGIPAALIEELDIWRAYRANDPPGIRPPNCGIILHGERGLGKTKIAEAIAVLLGGDYYECPPGFFRKPLLGQAEDALDTLVNVEPGKFRTILLDELSSALPKRHAAGSTMSASYTIHVDSVTEHFFATVTGSGTENPPFIFIGTTNRPEDIDPAALRPGRFGSIFRLTLPDQAVRVQLFRFGFRGDEPWVPENLEALSQRLAAQTDGKSGADINGAIQDAKNRAILAHRRITFEDFAAICRR